MPISPGEAPPTLTAPIAATAAMPRRLSPRSLSTSFDRFDSPLLSSVIEPAICTSDEDTVAIELSSLDTELSSLASDELTTVDCSDCVRLKDAIELPSVDIDAVLLAVTVVRDELTFPSVALMPETDVAKPPRLVLTLPRLELTSPRVAFVVESVLLIALTFAEVALNELASAAVEVLTPLSVVPIAVTDVLIFPTLVLIPVTELLTPPRLVFMLTTDVLTLTNLVLIITTDELRLPRLVPNPIWLVLTLPRLELTPTRLALIAT